MFVNLDLSEVGVVGEVERQARSGYELEVEAEISVEVVFRADETV